MKYCTKGFSFKIFFSLVCLVNLYSCSNIPFLSKESTEQAAGLTQMSGAPTGTEAGAVSGQDQTAQALQLGANLLSGPKINEDWRWDDHSRRWAFLKESPEPKIEMDAWSFAKGVIAFEVAAAQQLNDYKSRSHTLTLKVFQLADPQAFSRLIKTPSGLQQLLVEEQVDESILASNKLLVEPNGSTNLTLDRTESARFIGIVAGYYNLKGETVSRLIPIVGMDDNPPKINQGFIIETWLWLKGLVISDAQEAADAEANKLPIRPAKLHMQLTLGPVAIDHLAIKVK